MASSFDLTKFASISGTNANSRQYLRFLSKAAESAERYEDMCKTMRKLVIDAGDKVELDVEERNLLSVAFKNVIGSRRQTWRSLMQQLTSKEEKDRANKEILQVYKQQIEAELKSICDDVLELLTRHLVKPGLTLPEDKSVRVKIAESQVFYLKMTADYYRYLVEFSDNVEYKNQAKQYYQQATTLANAELIPTHPIRLGLALNYSVCYYEILKDADAARRLAKQAFDDAIDQLDQLDEPSYKDSTLIMQLLRDNLTLWTEQTDGKPADGGMKVEDVADAPPAPAPAPVPAAAPPPPANP